MLLLLAIQLSFAPARLLIKDHGHDMMSHVTLIRCHLGIQEERRRDTTKEGGVTDIETDIRGEVDEEEQLEVVI